LDSKREFDSEFQVAEFLKKLTVSPLALWERVRVRAAIRSKPQDLL
jgi:hypothetical protein